MFYIDSRTCPRSLYIGTRWGQCPATVLEALMTVQRQRIPVSWCTDHYIKVEHRYNVDFSDGPWSVWILSTILVHFSIALWPIEANQSTSSCIRVTTFSSCSFIMLWLAYPYRRLMINDKPVIWTCRFIWRMYKCWHYWTQRCLMITR